MSHDDPATKDATEEPPDRGGSSFRSLARVRVRWAAFSLAAAVLLGGSRVLADDGELDPGGGDGVLIHIDSPVPAQITEYGRYVGGHGRGASGYWETRPVCGSPCDRRISFFPNKRYVITGQFPESPPLRSYDLTGNVTITVHPGRDRAFVVGLPTLLVGVFTVGNPGVLFYLLGRSNSAALSGAGIGFMVAGGVTAIVGGVIMATGTTRINLQKTGAGSVGRAARVKPRYWMGEF